MEPTAQQVAQELLNRKAWHQHTVEYWFEHALPLGVEQVEAKLEQESREARSELALMLRYPDLNQPLGSAEFEVAFQKAQKAMQLPSDDQTRNDANTVKEYRRKFNEIRDLGIQVEHDVLPKLRDLRAGKGGDTLLPGQVLNMQATCATLSQRCRDDMPVNLHPHHPQEVYNLFAEDMKLLLKCAQANETRFKRQGVVQPHNKHADDVQERNRLSSTDWRVK